MYCVVLCDDANNGAVAKSPAPVLLVVSYKMPDSKITVPKFN
jgi:hypothetical protein